MRNAGLISGVAIIAMTTALSAKEFPLTFKTLGVEEAMSLPGGYGAMGSLTLTKTSALKKEPKAVSSRLLYGELGRRQGERGFLFRADESKGTGKGYDELILDLNQNGDLTDDPVVKRSDVPPVRKTPTPTTMSREISRFGPIEVSAAQAIGAWRPIYFAELNFYRRSMTGGDDRLPSSSLGQMRLRAGFYLETTVELDGIKQKVAVVDGNANLRLGDEPTPTTFDRDREKNWYFSPADAFLRDTDGSGKFNNRPNDPESSPFGALLYFGAVPYQVKLAENYASLRVEPCTEKLAVLSVKPNGDQVREAVLAWEQKPGHWTLIKPGVAQGRAQVPPGNYRLNGCVLEGRARDGEPLVLGGYYRKLDKTVVAQAGQTATLNCGAPLEARLTAEKQRRPETYSLISERNNPAKSSTVVLIQAEILGAGGETYATFAKGRSLNGEPAKPRFTIRDKDGKQVASGNLEYG